MTAACDLDNHPAQPPGRAARHRLLALSDYALLAEQWRALAIDRPWRCIRGPDIGMAMVRGRIGATGRVFNLGEMTLCRASVALDDGTTGHGWVRGRDRHHAELIALIDACARHERHRMLIDDTLLPALAAALDKRRRTETAETAATQVDFFTMVRGE
ncbi:phosphonate C-P lyase system protein PhnG [Kushneria phosphatilytica]|uniref:Phosphonate C-P lyase system protein PhnG n=1 Tax=Kushneria phosphatilytica TaxID=657387 RepID=A0A1S1NSR0_9GAMM|nr:phosphonate C-P lyase system protein PhnG [Kushneria phosphatilytica]OHV08635.1 phosphonate C-P lyase system protein PhnG [Kushneria phosphatilytica]QEL12343.1 phosphonate C-P lyase system protein PhnG [Kushneria phosphatilytica]